jgi:hypothetical protein
MKEAATINTPSCRIVFDQLPLPSTSPSTQYRKTGCFSRFGNKATMITLPHSFGDSTSSGLSDLESPSPPSEFYMASLTQQAPSSGEDTPTPNHPMVTHHKHQIKCPQSYDESSSAEDTPTATCPVVSRPEQKGKLSHRQSSRTTKCPKSHEESSSRELSELPIPTLFQSHPEIEMPLQEYTPTLPRSVPYLQGESNQQEPNVLQMHAITSQQFYAPWQGISVQQQPFAPQNGICAEERFVPDEQRPAISDLNNIDPALLDPELFPADPVLLNTGRPISIPVWETRHFRPLSVFHEEPSDLALSECEGDIDAPITRESTAGSKLVEKMKVTKYVYQIRDVEERKWKPRLRYGHRNFTTSRGSASKPKRTHPQNKYSLPDSSNSPIREHRHLKESTPIEVGSPKTVRTTIKKCRSIKQGKFADEQTRFIILIRIYWNLPFSKLTEAFNREFEKSWSITTIRTRFDAALDEPKFDEYRKALVKARDGSHKPEGLGGRLLWEAKGFLNRLEH